MKSAGFHYEICQISLWNPPDFMMPSEPRTDGPILCCSYQCWLMIKNSCNTTVNCNVYLFIYYSLILIRKAIVFNRQNQKLMQIGDHISSFIEHLIWDLAKKIPTPVKWEKLLKVDLWISCNFLHVLSSWQKSPHPSEEGKSFESVPMHFMQFPTFLD